MTGANQPNRERLPRRTGGRDNDTLYGGINNDTLIGGAADDRLFGGKGNDTLFANDNTIGNDSISGGEGADIIHFDQGGRRSSRPTRTTRTLSIPW